MTVPVIINEHDAELCISGSYLIEGYEATSILATNATLKNRYFFGSVIPKIPLIPFSPIPSIPLPTSETVGTPIFDDSAEAT